MLALNRTTIDFFSLDVEGAELQVLRGINFKKLHIRTMTVEYAHVHGGKAPIINYLTNHGMKLFTTVHADSHTWAQDAFFVSEKSFPDLQPLPDVFTYVITGFCVVTLTLVVIGVFVYIRRRKTYE